MNYILVGIIFCIVAIPVFAIVVLGLDRPDAPTQGFEHHAWDWYWIPPPPKPLVLCDPQDVGWLAEHFELAGDHVMVTEGRP